MQLFPPSVLAEKMEWSVTGVQLPMVVRLARFLAPLDKDFEHLISRESPLVILWVIGGVTAGEVALAKKCVAGTESKLTIGGGRLLSPKDALKMAFTHDCLA